MSASKYVSAQWMKSAFGGLDTIKAIGDDGVEYFIGSEASDVPPWPQFLADGGIIEPADPAIEVSQNITEVPDTLTGGPTTKEVFNGNQ